VDHAGLSPQPVFWKVFIKLPLDHYQAFLNNNLLIAQVSSMVTSDVMVVCHHVPLTMFRIRVLPLKVHIHTRP